MVIRFPLSLVKRNLILKVEWSYNNYSNYLAIIAPQKKIKKIGQ